MKDDYNNKLFVNLNFNNMKKLNYYHLYHTEKL